MGGVGIGNKGSQGHGNQRPKLPVYDSKTDGNGNFTWTMDHLMRECFFSNDTTLNQSATIQFIGPNSLNMTFLLYAGETFNERLPDFSSINITATDKWRSYVRSGQVD